MMNGRAADNGRIDVSEIADLIVQCQHPAYRVSSQDAERVVYGASWQDVMEAVRTEAVRTVGAVSRHYPASDDQAALEALGLNQDSFRELGIAYETTSQKTDGSNLELKRATFDGLCSRMKDSVVGYLIFDDLDVLHGSRPNATQEEASFLKEYMQKFAESVIYAIERKSRLHTFVGRMDHTTKANIANAFMIGLKPVKYDGGSARVEKSNLFISRGLCTDLKNYVEEIGRRSDRKTRDVVEEIASGIGVGTDKVEDFLEEREAPNIPETEALQSYLDRFSEVAGSPPNLLAHRTVMLYFREVSPSDVETGSVIEGVPETRYKVGRVTFTNFWPLVKAVEAGCRELDISRPAWNPTWGPEPDVDPEFLEHFNNILEQTSRGVIHRHTATV